MVGIAAHRPSKPSWARQHSSNSPDRALTGPQPREPPPSPGNPAQPRGSPAQGNPPQPSSLQHLSSTFPGWPVLSDFFQRSQWHDNRKQPESQTWCSILTTKLFFSLPFITIFFQTLLIGFPSLPLSSINTWSSWTGICVQTSIILKTFPPNHRRKSAHKPTRGSFSLLRCHTTVFFNGVNAEPRFLPGSCDDRAH